MVLYNFISFVFFENFGNVVASGDLYRSLGNEEFNLARTQREEKSRILPWSA